MITAYIGLGSNEGDRLLNLARAVDAISEISDTHVQAVSHAYESEPAYVTDQPLFANAVVAVGTEIESEALLTYLQQIEESLGRVRGDANGPRAIDLDILVFGDEELTSDELTIPHRGLLERDFVVTPLLEVAPRLHLPDGTRVSRDAVTVGAVVGDLGAIPDLGALHNEPVMAGEWVDIAEGTTDQDVVAGWDPQLMLKREVLEEAEIPYAWDPYEPELTTDPFGMPVQFRILVPSAYYDRACKLINDVLAAAPEFPEDLGGQTPEEADAAEEARERAQETGEQ